MAICADYAAEPINRFPLVILTQNIALEMRLFLRLSRLTDYPAFTVCNLKPLFIHPFKCVLAFKKMNVSLSKRGLFMFGFPLNFLLVKIKGCPFTHWRHSTWESKLKGFLKSL